MKHVIPRSEVPGVHRRSKNQPRLSRGLRRHNRQLIANYRRLQQRQPQRMTPVKVSQPVTPMSSGGWSTSMPAARANPPRVYWYNISPARNPRGDCPNCGDFGAHPQVAVTKIDSNYRESSTKLRRCGQCSQYFEDLPMPVTPPVEPKMEVVDYHLLLTASNSFQDCPHQGCDTWSVDTQAEVRDKRTGATHQVLRCPKGHYFKPYERPVSAGWWG